jgi:hypothetical protein
MIEFEPENPFKTTYGFERRQNPRTRANLNVYLVTTDQKKNERKIIKFQSINISRSGLLIDSGDFPFRKNSFVDLAFMAPIQENVSRLYYMDAFVQHTGNGKTGFSMTKKGPKP